MFIVLLIDQTRQRIGNPVTQLACEYRNQIVLCVQRLLCLPLIFCGKEYRRGKSKGNCAIVGVYNDNNNSNIAPRDVESRKVNRAAVPTYFSLQY